MAWDAPSWTHLIEAISEEQVQQTLQAAWDAGARYFDTASLYGYGKSEQLELKDLLLLALQESGVGPDNSQPYNI